MSHTALLIICWFTLSPITLAMATQSSEPQRAKQYISEILQQPEFQTRKTKCHWDYQESAASQPPKHSMKMDIVDEEETVEAKLLKTTNAAHVTEISESAYTP